MRCPSDRDPQVAGGWRRVRRRRYPLTWDDRGSRGQNRSGARHLLGGHGTAGRTTSKHQAGRSRRVGIGVPDASVTGLAGLVAVEEVTARLGMVAALDAAIGPVKQRDRGLTGGQLLVGMAAALRC